MLRRFAFLYKNEIDTGKHWIHIQLDEFLILYVFDLSDLIFICNYCSNGNKYRHVCFKPKKQIKYFCYLEFVAFYENYFAFYPMCSD